MTTFARNIAALRRRDPALADRLEAVQLSPRITIEAARSGVPTARVSELCLHSPYDPVREAETWAGQQAETFAADTPLTVLGFGLGHHLRAMTARGFSGTVIEPDLEILRAALEQGDLTDVLDRFTLLAGVPDDLIRRRHQGLLTGNVAGHPASLRVNEGLLGRLQRHAAGLAVMATGKLRILVVNPIYGGSLPTAHHCIRALRALGHQVFTFESEAFARAMDFTKTFQFTSSRRAFDGGLTSLLSQGVEIRARETRPDLILALAQAPILPQTMQNLEQRGIPTAFWFVEDYRVLTYWRDTAPYCSWLFGIQKDSFAQELAAIGMERYSYLPTCAAPDVHRPLELSPAQRNEFGSRLSFVGAGYFNRRVFFKGLTDYDLKIWGSEWPILFPLASHIQRNAARIDTEDCVRIFNASEVNLNLHSSLTCDGVVPDGDFVNPRAFEIPACGAFQLVDHRQLLPELFDAGEVETFTNLAEAREKIDRFLAAPDDRRAVAARARRRVLEEHTYEHRMAELLATMAGAFPHLAERVTERTERWDGLMADLDRHEGLAALLERLPDRRWFTLGDVLGTIATGKGAISRAERLFLMLQNVEVLWDRIPE